MGGVGFFGVLEVVVFVWCMLCGGGGGGGCLRRV